jgi:hypothetical protein
MDRRTILSDVRSLMRLSMIATIGLASCMNGGATDAQTSKLEVWPGNVNLGLTDDGKKFEMPIAARGGKDLFWYVLKEDRPRVSVEGDDTGAYVTAEFAGADELIVNSIDGQEIVIPVTVISYPGGSVDRGRAAVERIGCRRGGCHDMSGPDFTPSRIGGFDDRALSNWILRGRDVETGAMVPNHAWPLTLGEEQDVVAYLRSLPWRVEPVVP